MLLLPVSGTLATEPRPEPDDDTDARDDGGASAPVPAPAPARRAEMGIRSPVPPPDCRADLSGASSCLRPATGSRDRIGRAGRGLRRGKGVKGGEGEGGVSMSWCCILKAGLCTPYGWFGVIRVGLGLQIDLVGKCQRGVCLASAFAWKIACDNVMADSKAGTPSRWSSNGG
jgi:hypothetical protein